MVEPAKPQRDEKGRVLPGGPSLNPGGRLRKVSEIEQLITHCFGPKVLTALQKLFELGMSDATHTVVSRSGQEYDVPTVDARTKVAALTSFVVHVKGAPRSSSVKDEDTEPLPGDVAEMLRKLFERPELRRAALTVLEGGKK